MKNSIFIVLSAALMVLPAFVYATEVDTNTDTQSEAVNHAPIANDDSYTTGVDEVLTAAVIEGVLSNDTDNDGDSLTATLGTDVSNGTLSLNSDGSFTYTPNAGFDGSDSFTYSASDGKVSVTAKVDIIISLDEDTPFTLDDAYFVDEDTTLTVDAAAGVLANDNDPNSLPLTAVLESDVNDGTLTLASDGSFVYTPVHDFNGMESFTYRAFNGSLFGSTRTAVITVRPIDDAATSTATTTPETPGTTGGDGSQATTTTATSTDSTSSGTGSSSRRSSNRTNGSGSGSGSSSRGEVLGAQTGPACAVLYLNDYLRIGRDNNPREVMKLQTFLNTEMKSGLAVSGIFDTETYNAVKDFQLKYWEGVLKPWVPFGLESDHTPTGYVYKTTRWQINKIMCPSVTNPAPVLP